MLRLLFYPFRESQILFNLLGYITFRAIAAAVFSLLIGIWAGPRFIRWLIRFRIGQQIRGEGIPSLYEHHKAKAGTPTMGGILLLSLVLLSVILWGDLTNRLLILMIFVTVWLGLVGFLDDYIKMRRKSHRGLNKRQKLIGQFSIGLLVGLYLYAWPVDPNNPTGLALPFLKHFIPELGILYIGFVALVLVSTSNAVNITDGLDGLATGCVTIASAIFAIVAYLVGRVDASRYLYVLYIKGAGELSVFCAALLGASLAFLWFNCYPAQVFMGDVGALALGGALGCVAVLCKQELLLLIVGGVFVIEAASVILQVISVRRWGKRIFLIAPLHHHYQIKGWHEVTIVTRLWILAIVFGMLGLCT
ncbi:MAG TPA: phospho-N-acetylmuramoyl-pentapeptide-transferase, partial [bacterium]|nr:phospho-N-acetylmuramoyl-pentapeptide-transferase [bacterium]